MKFGYIQEDQNRNSENTRTCIWLRLFRIEQSVGVLSKFAKFIRILIFDKYGVDITCDTIVGPGLRMPHLQGIVVSRYTQIGRNCTIYHHVTIGANDLHGIEAPRIGNDVYIGCGAKIIGNIQIGNNVRIGANAVVTKDVPDNTTVVEFNHMITREHVSKVNEEKSNL